MDKNPRDATEELSPHAFDRGTGADGPASRYVDFDPDGYVSRPCSRCSSWLPEIVREAGGMQVVREWHQPSCPSVIEWQ